jgi:hypothetical protein
VARSTGGGPEQALLHRRALTPERLLLAQRQARLTEPLLHQRGQREVDVVAAQQQVLADRDALRAPGRPPRPAPTPG